MFSEKRKKWIFPVAMLVFLAVLVVFKLNGSSAAMYDVYFYGTSESDPNLIVGSPRPIRSDEWLVQTPWMISQVMTKSTGINQDIGNGLEFSVQNMPVWNWTLLFRPLFWGLYLLPLEQGFSLYWWGKSFLLVLASYFLALKFTNNKILVSVLLSITFLFSPFFQWWYSHTAIEAVGYASILLLLMISFMDQKIRIKTIYLLVGIVYFAFTLFLLLYPAFLLPVLYVTLFTFVGYIIQKRILIRHPNNQKKIILLMLSVLIVVGLCYVFYLDNQIPIETVRNTVYPGQRFVTGGGTSLARFLTGFYDRQLLSDTRELLPREPGNQTEFSSFFFFSLILTPWLIIEQFFVWRKTKKINSLLLLLLILQTIIVLWAIVGFPGGLAKYSLFYLSPPNRTQLGLGWVNLLIICVLIGNSSLNATRLRLPALIYAMICFTGFVILGYYFRSISASFLGSRKMIFFIAFSVGLMVFLLIQRRTILFSLCFLVFSLWTSLGVNPLYRGLSPYLNSDVSRVIMQRETLPNQKWVVFGNWIIPNYVLANGGRIYNGTFFYPDLSYIDKLDPEKKFDSVYNRYSHINFKYNDLIEAPTFELLYPDSFSITVDPCDPVFDELGINNFVFNESVKYPCLQAYDEVHEPNMSFFFYYNDVANQ